MNSEDVKVHMGELSMCICMDYTMFVSLRSVMRCSLPICVERRGFLRESNVVSIVSPVGSITIDVETIVSPMGSITIVVEAIREPVGEYSDRRRGSS